jgi:hypothetical protein
LGGLGMVKIQAMGAFNSFTEAMVNARVSVLKACGLGKCKTISPSTISHGTVGGPFFGKSTFEVF